MYIFMLSVKLSLVRVESEYGQHQRLLSLPPCSQHVKSDTRNNMDQRRMSLNEQAVYRKHTNTRSYNGDRDVTRTSFVDPTSTSKQAVHPTQASQVRQHFLQKLVHTHARSATFRAQKMFASKHQSHSTHRSAITQQVRFLVDPTHKTSQAHNCQTPTFRFLVILLIKPCTTTPSSNADILVLGDPTHKTLTTSQESPRLLWTLVCITLDIYV